MDVDVDWNGVVWILWIDVVVDWSVLVRCSWKRCVVDGSGCFLDLWVCDRGSGIYDQWVWRVCVYPLRDYLSCRVHWRSHCAFGWRRHCHRWSCLHLRRFVRERPGRACEHRWWFIVHGDWWQRDHCWWFIWSYGAWSREHRVGFSHHWIRWWRLDIGGWSDN